MFVGRRLSSIARSGTLRQTSTPSYFSRKYNLNMFKLLSSWRSWFNASARDSPVVPRSFASEMTFYMPFRLRGSSFDLFRLATSLMLEPRRFSVASGASGRREPWRGETCRGFRTIRGTTAVPRSIKILGVRYGPQALDAAVGFRQSDTFIRFCFSSSSDGADGKALLLEICFRRSVSFQNRSEPTRLTPIRSSCTPCLEN